MDDKMMIEILGNPASPFTRKLVAALRYRRIPFIVRWGMGRPPNGYPAPKVPLMPVLYVRDQEGALKAACDTTPILADLEGQFKFRSLDPADPVLSFLSALIEDYADEWVNKAMFHYRWAHVADATAASRLISYLKDPSSLQADAETFEQAFSARQVGRLNVVGSSKETGFTIESSYRRLLGLLDKLIETGGFVLGFRPSTADFGLYGQLTQLGLIDPTPARYLREEFPRLHAWLLYLEDLSGWENGDWDSSDFLDRYRPLIEEIDQTYGAVMLANERAVLSGKIQFQTLVNGHPWQQSADAYQAKCLRSLRAKYGALVDNDKHRIERLLKGTLCGLMLDES